MHFSIRAKPMLQFQDYLRASSSVQLLLEFGDSLHLQRSRLLAGTGLTLTRLADVNGVVTPKEEMGVITNLLGQMPEPAGAGLVVGLRHQLTAYGILGYGLMSSATVRDAMILASRFLPLTYTFVKIGFFREGKQSLVVFGVPEGLPPAVQRFVVERAMAATSRVIADMTEETLVLDSFDLEYPAPLKPAADLPDRVLGAAIRYGAQFNALRFPFAQLERALPGANPSTAAMCERLCQELISQRRTTLTTAMIVRDFLKAAPAGSLLVLGDLAGKLNISERTLKRKLQAESTSFSDLQAETLRERAQQLLAGEMSLTQIAEVLGFADLSTFSQAYKRWTGVAPSVSRETLQRR